MGLADGAAAAFRLFRNERVWHFAGQGVRTLIWGSKLEIARTLREGPLLRE
jgi:hypothetical protein